MKQIFMKVNSLCQNKHCHIIKDNGELKKHTFFTLIVSKLQTCTRKLWDHKDKGRR